MLNRFDFASAGVLQQGKTLARFLLCIPVALPLVLDFQVSPFIGIDGLEIGSVELAIGRGLR